MLKKRIIAVLAGLALMAAITGSSGIGGDAFGLDGTSPAYACNSTSGSGGC